MCTVYKSIELVTNIVCTVYKKIELVTNIMCTLYRDIAYETDEMPFNNIFTSLGPLSLNSVINSRMNEILNYRNV